MSPNRDLPHLLVLPEDDANRQMAVGFYLALNSNRQVQILPSAGGWVRVVDSFQKDHTTDMRRSKQRLMALLFDLDGDSARVDWVRAEVPADLRDRVFIVGALTTPEALKQDGMGWFSDIGRKLAEDCHDNTRTHWGHPLLQHNEPEVGRLRHHLVEIGLFGKPGGQE